jgi:hypothetical protein
VSSVLIAVQGFGSMWERRFGKDLSDSKRFARAAYYNTTAVPVNGKLRYRWRVGGKLRFNSREGINPNYPLRAVGRLFECADPEARSGWSQILLTRAARTAERPSAYLFAVTAERTGYIDTQSAGWRADSVQVVSLSEDHGQQEILLLMPAYSWVRGDLGTFFVEPSPVRPCSAQLQLGHV